MLQNLLHDGDELLPDLGGRRCEGRYESVSECLAFVGRDRLVDGLLVGRRSPSSIDPILQIDDGYQKRSVCEHRLDGGRGVCVCV